MQFTNKKYITEVRAQSWHHTTHMEYILWVRVKEQYRNGSNTDDAGHTVWFLCKHSRIAKKTKKMQHCVILNSVINNENQYC